MAKASELTWLLLTSGEFFQMPRPFKKEKCLVYHLAPVFKNSLFSSTETHANFLCSPSAITLCLFGNLSLNTLEIPIHSFTPMGHPLGSDFGFVIPWKLSSLRSYYQVLLRDCYVDIPVLFFFFFIILSFLLATIPYHQPMSLVFGSHSVISFAGGSG